MCSYFWNTSRTIITQYPSFFVENFEYEKGGITTSQSVLLPVCLTHVFDILLFTPGVVDSETKWLWFIHQVISKPI